MSDSVPIRTQIMRFHDHDLQTWRDDETGTAYVSVKGLCLGIGVEPSPQYQKLRSDSFLRKYIKAFDIVTPGGKQTVWGLDVNQVHWWLAGITMRKAAPEVQEKLTVYKSECSVALRDYWVRGVAVNPRFHAGDVHTNTPLKDLDYLERLADFYDAHNGLTPERRSKLCEAADRLLTLA